jgi:hypothetical protein
MSLMRSKRLEQLEAIAKRRTAFVPGPPAEVVAAALRGVLAELAIVHAAPVWCRSRSRHRRRPPSWSCGISTECTRR